MKYYIIAGEASGDLHASNLMHQIKLKDPQADFRFFGGDLMLAEGGVLVRHYKDLAFMGLFEVIANIRTIMRNMQFCKSDIVAYKPDVVILVDYPGFNLRIAEFVHKQGVKVYYYISPKIWAWKQSRAHKIKAFVDKMFVIFPFEIDFYKQYNYEVFYVGNPLLDEIKKKKQTLPDRKSFLQHNNLPDKPIIALLAGSRKQEIKRLLPEMIQVVKSFPEHQFIIAGAPTFNEDYYRQITGSENVKVLFNQTYSILAHAAAAVVTSGTATLETALFRVPQVVCYKTSPATYHVGKHFVDIKYFSLVNIIMDAPVVKELLQFNLAADIKTETENILFNKDYRAAMLNNYDKLIERLGESGASERSADIIVESLKK